VRLVTDLIDKLTASSEIAVDGRLRLAGGRVPAGSFVSDGSTATLSPSSTEIRH